MDDFSWEKDMFSLEMDEFSRNILDKFSRMLLAHVRKIWTPKKCVPEIDLSNHPENLIFA